MDGPNKKPTVVLSLVKDQPNDARFISLESLEPERRQIAQKYHRIIAPQSVLVGVVAFNNTLPQNHWDIRPVYLLRGMMLISRIFSDELNKSSSLRDEFKSYIFNVERLFPDKQNLICGSAEGYSWVTRKYFNTLLSDNNLNIPLTKRPTLVKQLLEDIKNIHEHNCVHGHITPSNVAYENDRFYLIDYGIHIKDPAICPSPTLAPELRESVAGKINATTACDLYGIGLIAKRLFGGELQVEYGNLIEVLLLQDPKLRPSLEQVMSHFSDSIESQSYSQSKIITTPKNNIASSIKIDLSKISYSRIKNLFIQHFRYILGVTFLIVTLIGIRSLYTMVFYPQVQINQEELEELSTLWDSGQATLMQTVVEKAFNNNQPALLLLFEKLKKPAKNPLIQQRLFMIAFHPLWANQISNADLKALLIYGTPSLVPSKLRQAPDLSNLHPAVAFAVSASVPPEPNFVAFKNVTTKHLSKLPSIYGTSFLALHNQNVLDLSDVSAQSLAHILTANYTAEIILSYLQVNLPTEISFLRLNSLVPLCENLPDLDKAIIQALSLLSNHPLSWFAKDVVAGWENVPSLVKINLFNQVFPSEITFEQNIDLLRFPLASIRDKAKQKLVDTVGGQFKNLIEFLSSSETILTRTQSISLLATLLVPSEKSKKFVLQWFETEPNPQSIKMILLFRPPSTNDNDPFNISAARYLLSKDVEVSLDEARVLLKHQEVLVRAFAYSKLSLETESQKKEFIELLKQEKDKSLKQRQIERLK